MKLFKYLPLREKPHNIRARAVKWLILFGIWMIILTLLSRAASNLTIPQVEAVAAARNALEYNISVPGEVKENQIYAVTTVPGIRVRQIAVSEGENVKSTDTLFVLDMDDLQEQIRMKRRELKKADLGIQDMEERKALEEQEALTAQNRAQEDYNRTVQSADASKQQAYEALQQAQSRLLEFEQNSSGKAADDAVMQNLKQQCKDKKAAAGQAEQKLKEAKKGSDEKEIEAAEKELKKAEKELKEAQEAYSQYQSSRKAEKNQTSSQERQALEDACRQAEIAYEEVAKEWEKSLEDANRLIDDSMKPQAPDSSLQIAKIDRKSLKSELQKLKELYKGGGIILAAVDGVVTEIHIEAGNDTIDGKNIAIADTSTGSRFQAQITKEQKKYISKGDQVVLEQDGAADAVKGLKVDSVKADRENQELWNVTVMLPDNSLEIGSTAEMKIQKKTKEYSCVLPIEALRSEEDQLFVLVPEKRDTVLGNELVASKVYVEVLEKSDRMAAISDSSSLSGQSVIISSEKPIKEGDRICLKEEEPE